MSDKEEEKKELPSQDYSDVYWCEGIVYRHVIFSSKDASLHKKNNIYMSAEWRVKNNLSMGMDWIHYGWFESAALFRRPPREGEKPLAFKMPKHSRNK